jgi:hypothetical protein
MKPVYLYSTPGCHLCEMAREIISQKYKEKKEKKARDKKKKKRRENKNIK